MNFDRFQAPSRSDASAAGRRGVHHHHPALGGRGDVDVVQPDARPCDHLEVGPRGQRLRIDPGRTPDHHRGRVGERGQQRGPVGAVDVPDLDVLAEHLQHTRGQLFGDQDDGPTRGHGHRA
jgi:hypothetical protein